MSNEISVDHVFDDTDAMPEFPEVAFDLVDELNGEGTVTAIGFASLLSEVLTDEQKAKLSDWERAALQNLTNLSDECGLEEIGAALR